MTNRVSTKTHRFDVVELKMYQQYANWKIDAWDSEQQSHVIYGAIGSYLRGSQCRESVREEYRVIASVDVPATTWDSIKHSIVAWMPLLRFGFLVPRYETIETHVEQELHQTIYNIFPMAKGDRSTGGDVTSLNPVDWLNARPPSEEEINKAAILLMAEQRL